MRTLIIVLLALTITGCTPIIVDGFFTNARQDPYLIVDPGTTVHALFVQESQIGPWVQVLDYSQGPDGVLFVRESSLVTAHSRYIIVGE